MKKTLTLVFIFFSYLFCDLATAQITLLGSFNPSGASSLCGIGYDPDAAKIWIYGCSSSTIQSYSTTGVLINSFAEPGGTANDVDVEIAPVELSLNGTIIAQGQVLFVNGESNAAEIYAIDNVSGTVLSTLNTAFGASHVVGGSYHPLRGTFFMVQDNVPSATLENLIGEVDPLTGNVLQSFQITDHFSVSYGDIEVGANGNLFIVSSVESSIAEYTPAGNYVQEHALPVGVSSLSGIAIDCSAGEAWVSSTSGNVYHLGQFPGGTLIAPVIEADGPTTFCVKEEVNLSVTTSGGVTYAWKKGSNLIDGATNSSFTATKSGKYSCVVSNACKSLTSNKIEVTANKNPKAIITPSGNTSGCPVNLTADAGIDYCYQWKLNDSNISGATNQTYVATVSGAYKVTVKNCITGCKKNSKATNVTIACRSSVVTSQADIYPNPFYNDFSIHLGGLSSTISEVLIFDLAGKLMECMVVNSDVVVAGSHLMDGVYFVQLKSGNEIIQNMKLVKVK
ncbi:MAG: T9SS type A sorting domain-containing protein [Chitinophagales bacterium]